MVGKSYPLSCFYFGITLFKNNVEPEPNAQVSIKDWLLQFEGFVLKDFE